MGATRVHVGGLGVGPHTKVCQLKHQCGGKILLASLLITPSQASELLRIWAQASTADLAVLLSTPTGPQ